MDKILVLPCDCNASISSLSAPVPKVLIIPIPLVAPVIELFVTVPAAAPNAIPAPVVAAPPIVPEIISDPDQIMEMKGMLRAFGGKGVTDDGTPIYRLIVGNVYP